MNVLTKVPANVRKYIYVAVTLVVSVLVVLGIVDKSVVNEIGETVGIIGGIIIAFQSLLAASNVTPPQ